MLSFAFEEKDEIEDKKEKAEDSQKDPESRQGEDVDEYYRQPEEDGEELSYPEDHDVASRGLSDLG